MLNLLRRPNSKNASTVNRLTVRTARTRRQVAQGLDGNPQAAQKARLFLREWFGGKIRLEPLADGGLMAHWNQNINALVSTAVGTFGSGGRI